MISSTRTYMKRFLRGRVRGQGSRGCRTDPLSPADPSTCSVPPLAVEQVHALCKTRNQGTGCKAPGPSYPTQPAPVVPLRKQTRGPKAGRHCSCSRDDRLRPNASVENTSALHLGRFWTNWARPLVRDPVESIDQSRDPWRDFRQGLLDRQSPRLHHRKDISIDSNNTYSCLGDNVAHLSTSVLAACHLRIRHENLGFSCTFWKWTARNGHVVSPAPQIVAQSCGLCPEDKRCRQLHVPFPFFSASYQESAVGLAWQSLKCLDTGLADVAWRPPRAVPNGEKKIVLLHSFPKKARGHSMCSTMVGGGWRLAVGGWRLAAIGGWQLATGDWWRLVVVGGGWWSVIGGWWRLVVVGGRRLVVGGWWRLAVGGSWRLAVGGGWQLVGVGGWRLVVPWGGP